MRVVLLSNVAYYYPLATALAEAGRLQRFITSMALLPQERLPRFFPLSLRQKLEGRRLPASVAPLTTRLPFPEVLQQLLMRGPAPLADRADWIHDSIFGALALPFLNEADIFHFVNSVGLLGARRARRLGMHTVCDVRQEHPAYQRELLDEEFQRLGLPQLLRRTVNIPRMLAEYHLADLIVVPSEYAKRTFLHRGFAETRVVSVPYGVNLEHFHRVANHEERAMFRILYVGRITPRKGVHYLLEAVARLQLPQLQLVLVGQIDQRMKPLLKKYEGQFIHVTSVPKSELPQWYSKCDVFVLPSLADAFGLVVLEAMACEVPVIVTENVGAADVLREGEEGYVIPIRSVEALSHRMSYLYNHRKRAREMGLAAATAARRQSWGQYAHRVNDTYASLENRFKIETTTSPSQR
jgi:starch synthase